MLLGSLQVEGPLVIKFENVALSNSGSFGTTGLSTFIFKQYSSLIFENIKTFGLKTGLVQLSKDPADWLNSAKIYLTV